MFKLLYLPTGEYVVYGYVGDDTHESCSLYYYDLREANYARIKYRFYCDGITPPYLAKTPKWEIRSPIKSHLLEVVEVDDV